MNNVDKEYFRLLNIVLEKGRVKKNRTGIDTIGVFGEQAKFDISYDAFPVLTTKKIFWRGIVHELLWFIKGDTNIKYLVDNDVHIWDEWAYKRHCEMCKQTGRGLPTQDEFIHHLKTHPKSDFGELGEGTYGGMWRAFPYAEYFSWELPRGVGSVGPRKGDGYNLKTVDQLQKLIDKLKSNPDDRRLIVSAWHPYLVDHCALPPCHVMFHFNTEELTDLERYELAIKHQNKPRGFGTISWESSLEFNPKQKRTMHVIEELNIPKRKLNCLLYQRSCDTFLGVPFNISSYCLLTVMIAHVTNMVPGTFTHAYGDLHIYTNHLEQVKTQLSRDSYSLPKLWLNPEIKSLFDFKYEDIRLENYQSHPTIKADVAV